MACAHGRCRNHVPAHLPLRNLLTTATERVSGSPHPCATPEGGRMPGIDECLRSAMTLPGALGASLVDLDERARARHGRAVAER